MNCKKHLNGYMLINRSIVQNSSTAPYTYLNMATPKLPTMLLSILVACLCVFDTVVFGHFKYDLPTGVTGPESAAFGRFGVLPSDGPFTTATDGRSMKWQGSSIGFVDFAYTSSTRSNQFCDGATDPDKGPICGRPLALSFQRSIGLLYIANAYFGDVYLTDAGLTYEIRNTTQPGFQPDSTGRFLRYNIVAKQVSILLSGLLGGGGPAVSSDGRFVLVPEYNGMRISEYWLAGPKTDTELLLNTAGNPRKITRAERFQEFGWQFLLETIHKHLSLYLKEFGSIQMGSCCKQFHLLHNTSIKLAVVSGQFNIFSKYDLPTGVSGPESAAFGALSEGPFTTVTDGRIMKWLGSHIGFVDFAYTTSTRSKKLCDGTTDPDLGPVCGRPLALRYQHSTGLLYIVDAYIGLLVVGPIGGLATPLVGGFKYLTGVDVNLVNGDVYFIDASLTYELRNTTQPGFTADATGRLLRYNPVNKQVSVLLSGLNGGGGPAVSSDVRFVMVPERTGMRISKYWLAGPKANTAELLLNPSGNPNKINLPLLAATPIGVTAPKSSQGRVDMLCANKLDFEMARP
ncbi:strictosidine synthase-like 11-like protein [Tanacetum coccineum]|uniref:Strictosidine synthase-like 11-like protein n=1 Tax=Tanacetum coccineum TaxID=301880 RepID=A0ABQ4X9B2_9ASTR